MYYGVITDSGEVVRVIHKPGIHFKIPLFQELHLIHKSSAISECKFQVTSKDGISMEVKGKALWKVYGPGKYFVKLNSFDSSIEIINKYVIDDSIKNISKANSTEFLRCSNKSQSTDFCEVHPSVFVGAMERITKSLEPYGIKISNIEASANINNP
jgi:hypothetical protein